MPESWHDLSATLLDNSDGVLRKQVIQEMNLRLFKEEDELRNGHSETLRREIDIIK
jgi:hypothetical protein